MTVVPGRTERRVFVDSSAYLALLDKRDEHHSEATQILHALADQTARQFTCNVIVMEAHALILSTGGIRVGQAFLRSTEASNTTIVRVRASDEERAREIIYRYDDKGFSLVDAISSLRPHQTVDFRKPEMRDPLDAHDVQRLFITKLTSMGSGCFLVRGEEEYHPPEVGPNHEYSLSLSGLKPTAAACLQAARSVQLASRGTLNGTNSGVNSG